MNHIVKGDIRYEEHVLGDIALALQAEERLPGCIAEHDQSSHEFERMSLYSKIRRLECSCLEFANRVACSIRAEEEQTTQLGPKLSRAWLSRSLERYTPNSELPLIQDVAAALRTIQAIHQAAFRRLTALA